MLGCEKWRSTSSGRLVGDAFEGAHRRTILRSGILGASSFNDYSQTSKPLSLNILYIYFFILTFLELEHLGHS